MPITVFCKEERGEVSGVDGYGRWLDFGDAAKRSGAVPTVADDLAVFFDALEERGPLHQVGQVEVQVVVLRQRVQVA